MLIFVSDIENDKFLDLLNDLSKVEEIYNQEFENFNDESNDVDDVNSTNENGVIVFAGGSSLTIRKSQFDQLKTMIMDLRTSIIEGN